LALTATATATATALARDWFTEALRIAHEISSAPDEAQALEGMGRCHRSDGAAATARTLLSQALEIYRRIGSPRADRVSALLES
jgi:Tetratricopeptide repeat